MFPHIFKLVATLAKKRKKQKTESELRDAASELKLVEVTPFLRQSDEGRIFISTFCPVPSYVVLRTRYLVSALMFVQPDITHKLSSSSAAPHLTSPMKQAKKNVYSGSQCRVRTPLEGHQINVRGREMINGRKKKKQSFG